MENSSPMKKPSRKRKKKMKSPVETKSSKLEEVSEQIISIEQNADIKKTQVSRKSKELSAQEIAERYPVLMDKELVQKFMNVPLTNNQKGRIRQVLRDNLKGTADSLLPDVIHSRIQGVLKSSPNLMETDLRKIRILYNMLNTALKAENSIEKKVEKKIVTDEKNTDKSIDNNNDEVKKPKVKKPKIDKPDGPVKEQPTQKVKGMKRYVVFIGNLPLGVEKETIMNHFSELNEHIVDVRIPKQKEDKKSAIAYVELKNEPTYEMALSKHHSMLGNKRINVLYTTQQKTKISKAEAKSKAAKMVALQKAGKLAGSTALVKKRSHRRAKMKKARANENA